MSVITIRKAPPVRRKVSKALVHQRLIEAGKMAAAKVALDADANAYGRWFAPGFDDVYADDPDALALLKAIGADPDAIMAEDTA
ncbi:MAG: hypothetical protein KF810_16800 [Rhizobiaceae bacterium]|nr:hypothetical protein [Rhizobiaceae bacterium]